MHFIHGLNTGGAETLVKDYLLNLDRKKFNISLLCLEHRKESPYEKILENDGIKIFYVEDYLIFKKNTNIIIKVINHFCRCIIVRKIIKKEAPDILHTHLSVNTFVKFARPKRETVILHTVHNEPRKIWFNNGVLRRLDLRAAKWLVKHYEMRFIVLHEKMKEEIDVLFGVNSVVLNNGIDISKYKNLKNKNTVRLRLGIPEKSFVVGHIGRFAKQKNHDFLVEVFNEIKNKDKFLLMVGDGHDAVRITDKLCKYGLDDQYLILSNRDDIPDILAAMDVFVFPSKHEGLPVSLVEVQEAKLSCFVSDVVSEHAVISNLVTMLPLDDGAKKWAGVIMKYKKPQRVVLNDREWDIKKITKQLENIYENALKEKNNGKK